ncbi:MAG: hypothetical protein HN742_13415 [Lentisphaerae bacterium]|nr:hypothetical protein [Lentisphaerota bacterium]MBT4820878.1 hypothetical protein [Lentisphaerota bacterium]MBT5608213.1 hypothetical protein [Lentisphaerota bacterium]MBT7058898.1 hypothetical protein [Lentisphaerota bacterium]MBT7842871.1 hypothetical protein [Lentisphaerota bacterium]
MRFRRYGRTHQLRIETADDLRDVLELDESLWCATGAPISAYRCDAKFLQLVDHNTDGRIHTEELHAAIRWVLDSLSDYSGLTEKTDVLPLAAIRGDTPAGAALLRSAKYVLQALEIPDGVSISLGQLRGYMATVKTRPLNGDGVIVAEACKTPETAEFIGAVLSATGGTDEAGGKKGVSEKNLKDFVAAVPALLDWRARGNVDPESETAEHLLFGADTGAVHDVLVEHAADVDLFFRLCGLVAYDARTMPRVGGLDANASALNPATPAEIDAYLQSLPIASPTADGVLPLDEASINPLFRGWISRFRDQVVQRILGEIESIDLPAWQQIRAALAPYQAYLAEKKVAIVDALPTEKLEHYRNPAFEKEALELIAADKEVAEIMNGLQQLERLILYHRYLLDLANNFVSFPDLYDVKGQAMFEVGALIMDGRWFGFAVKVDNVAAHSAVAKKSSLFVMYVEVTPPTGTKMTVAVAATSGTKGNLGVGKRGVFFDTSGQEHDAKVVQVIENPVSLREALAVPFLRLWALAEGKIESWSGGAGKKLDTEFNKLLAAPAAAPAAPAGRPGGGLVGVGVVAAALGSSFAFVIKTISSMSPQQVVGGVATAALLVVFPISLIAVLKLRRQDLSALLEGCGWAVNVRMRLNRGQRQDFTHCVDYPEGAEGTPKRHWLRMTIVALLLIATLVGGVRSCRALSGAPPAVEPQAEVTPAVTPPAATK